MMYDILLDAVQNRTDMRRNRTLLLSVNPDLKSDFGHFLNYEKRINEICGKAGIVHHCLTNLEFKSSLPYMTAAFKYDSGHYCLHRKSSTGREVEFSTDLHHIIINWIDQQKLVESFDEIIVFIYMSSTRSAAQLSCLKWPEKTKVVANSFWDFLSPWAEGEDPDLARLKLQGTVGLMAMSTTHKKKIAQTFGHNFGSIPNPPPLVSDRDFHDLVRKNLAAKTGRDRAEMVVFLPGLMTQGKGKELTVEFLQTAEMTFPGCRFVARDRTGDLAKALKGATGARVSYQTGDFTDAEIIDLYGNADVAILPYSSAVFEYRTSGALVDCLMSATVPVVLPGTWLADVCTEFDFGIIAGGETLQDLYDALRRSEADLKGQLGRMLSGAVRYMQNNSWTAFLQAITPVGAGALPVPVKAMGNVLELEQLRANFKALSAFATALEARVAAPVALAPGVDLLAQLAAATDADGARLLLTTVGSGLLLNHGVMAGRLAAEAGLRDSVDRALATLPADDGHKVQFLRVQQRAGIAR